MDKQHTTKKKRWAVILENGAKIMVTAGEVTLIGSDKGTSLLSRRG
jgi:hypothetical protein